MAFSLQYPSPGQITSGYGPRTPGAVGSSNHKGIDFSWMRPDRVQDWNIYAAASGTVVFVGYYGGWGNLIRIRHALGYETWYAHQSAFKVHKGQKVAAGQVIGVIGNTGTSGGAHLHFELRLFGVPVDPTNKFTATAGDRIIILEPELEHDMIKLYCKTADAQGRHHYLVGEASFQPLSLGAAQEEWKRPGKVINVDPATRDRWEARAMDRRAELRAGIGQPVIDYTKLAQALKAAEGGSDAGSFTSADRERLNAVPTAAQNGQAARTAIVKA